MVIEFDPAKDASNEAKHGVSLARFVDMDETTAIYRTQVVETELGPENRLVVVGRIDGRVHVAVITPRPPGVRVISLRKANDREVRDYEAHDRP